MDTFTVMQAFETQERLHTNEGRRGVENLCRILHAMGYNGENFGRFHPRGSLGDLIQFLEDNSGCVEAIKDWICEEGIDEWTNSLRNELDCELCEGCGEPMEECLTEGELHFVCTNCTDDKVYCDE